MAKKKKGNISKAKPINDLQNELLSRLGDLESIIVEKKQAQKKEEEFYRINVNRQRGLSIRKYHALKKGDINRALDLEKDIDWQKKATESAKLIYQQTKNELKKIVEDRVFTVTGSMGNIEIPYSEVFGRNLNVGDILRQDVNRIRKEIDSAKFQKESSDNRKRSAYNLYMKRLSGLNEEGKNSGKNYLTKQETEALKIWSSQKKQLSEKEFINKMTVGKDRLDFRFLDNPKFKLPSVNKKVYTSTIKVIGNFINVY